MVDKRIHRVRAHIVALLLCLYPGATYAQSLIIPKEVCTFFSATPECIAKRDAVVVVPGIVGSFNGLSLFADISKGSWGPVPFYKIYEGLIMRLEVEGYVQRKSLFVAYYDWRQPNAESAREYLAPIIAKAKEKTGRVDIIAHSMGGLLVQQYINSDQYTPGEIDRFVMLGTPNEGASAAYLPWEGGVFPSTWSAPVRFYMSNIASALRKRRNIQDIPPKSYRLIFPSLKELLPVGNYITKNGTASSSSERNTFLENLLAARSTLFTGIGVTTIAGIDNNTLGAVELSGERSNTDIQLERWRDGHPLQEVPAPNNPEGDMTVLKSSALFGTRKVTVGNVPHNALPEYAQKEALGGIGIANSKPKIFTYQEPKWLTGFVVLSPVDITITDANGKTVSKDINDFGDDAYIEVSSDEGEDNPKIIILRNLEPGTYTVNLTGTDTGSYTVIVTHADKETVTSETLTGTTTLGKQESFTVTIGEDTVAVSDITEESALRLAPLAQGKGDEQDCCPGHDEEIKPVKKGRVLGATMKKIIKRRNVSLQQLQPLNNMFFSVYGQMPIFSEWKYWADRYLTDKPSWELLRGTMQWHKERGNSIVHI